MNKIAVLLAACSMMSACTVVPQSHSGYSASTSAYAGNSAPRGPGGPMAPRGPVMAASAGQAALAARPEERQCLAELSQTGAQFTPVVDNYFGNGCSQLGTVQMTALVSDSARLSLGNLGPVQCGVGEAFAGWARYGVDRAARQILGSPLMRIETFGSYSCRNVAGSQRRSAHATAGAIDIAAFVLADGRRVVVSQDWSDGTPQEKEFLRTVQRSACRRFATVLGPEYNAAHHDHFHVEGVISGDSYCR